MLSECRETIRKMGLPGLWTVGPPQNEADVEIVLGETHYEFRDQYRKTRFNNYGLYCTNQNEVYAWSGSNWTEPLQFTKANSADDSDKFTITVTGWLASRGFFRQMEPTSTFTRNKVSHAKCELFIVYIAGMVLHTNDVRIKCPEHYSGLSIILIYF